MGLDWGMWLLLTGHPVSSAGCEAHQAAPVWGMHCIRCDRTGLLCSRCSRRLLPQRAGLQRGAGYVWAATVHMKLGTSALQREEGCSIRWDLKRWMGNRNGVLGLAGDASVRNRAKRGVLFNNSSGRPRTRPVAQKGDSQAPLKSTGPLPTVTVAIWSAFMALHPLLDRAPTRYWQDLPAGGHLTLEAVRLKALLMGK